MIPNRRTWPHSALGDQAPASCAATWPAAAASSSKLALKTNTPVVLCQLLEAPSRAALAEKVLRNQRKRIAQGKILKRPLVQFSGEWVNTADSADRQGQKQRVGFPAKSQEVIRSKQMVGASGFVEASCGREAAVAGHWRSMNRASFSIRAMPSSAFSCL